MIASGGKSSLGAGPQDGRDPVTERSDETLLPARNEEHCRLMLWNGEMELGPILMAAFRRGLALGSLSGITHVRVMPSPDWIEMHRFSGSGSATAPVSSSNPESLKEPPNEGIFFCRPSSPYRWMGGLAAAWSLLSLLAMLLPYPFKTLGLLSALGAFAFSIASGLVNRRVWDPVIPLLCVGMLMGWAYLTFENREMNLEHGEPSPVGAEEAPPESAVNGRTLLTLGSDADAAYLQEGSFMADPSELREKFFP